MDQKNEKQGNRIAFILAVLIIWAFIGHPIVYFSKSIEGTVVSDKTGKPIDSAIVVAQWILYQAGPGHGGHGPRLVVRETKTNSEGKFYFRGWGPRFRVPTTYLTSYSPGLYVFKGGYAPKFLTNNLESNNVIRDSDWDGKEIELGNRADEVKNHLGRINSFIFSLRNNRDDWREMPLMTEALNMETEWFYRQGIARGYVATVPKSN